VKPLVHKFARRRRSPYARRQPAWMKNVRVGDVLECYDGRVQRIVRAVTFYACGALWGVEFTIKHCSWTHRCHTIVDACRLQSEGWRPAGHRVRLTRPLDRRIAREIMDLPRTPRLDCCDVKGIA